MQLTKTLMLPVALLFTSGGLAEVVDKRQQINNIASVQNNILNVQLASQNLGQAVLAVNPAVGNSAQVVVQQVALVEQAMQLALVQLQSSQVLTLQEAQLLLASANTLTQTIMSTTTSFIVLQPTLNQVQLGGVAIQSLQAQQVLVSQLGQVVLTKVPPQAVGIFQSGFGQAVSTLDFGVAQLQGRGAVAVQLVQAGQIPVAGVEVLAQQCAAIGFAPVNQVFGINAINEQNQQQIIAQQCGAVGFVDVRQVQAFQQVLGQQQLINQCAAVGLVPVNNQFVQQDLANQCLAIGFVPANQLQQVQGVQVNQQDVFNQCAQIGFVQAAEGSAVSGQELVGSLMMSHVIQGVPLDQFAAGGQLPAGAQELAQQCLGIGFVQANQFQGDQQQQFVASPEQCAAFGLVQQNDQNVNQQQQQQQGVVDQCAALGFQVSEQVNTQAVAELEQQLGIQTAAVQGEQATATAASTTTAVAAEATAAEATAAEAAAAAPEKRQEEEEEEEGEEAIEVEAAVAGTAAVEAATAAASVEAAAATASVEVAAATAVAGQVSAEQCALLGFVQLNNAANATAASAVAATTAAAESVAAESVATETVAEATAAEATASVAAAAGAAPERRARRRRAAFSG